ncbi:mitochondrial import translocase, subunit Tom22 [Schizophyllum commune Tattone D]|nr:mitochondrial import translocase, subunit Tom22 [Schizophyllum commune Tattone D]
MVQVEIVDEKDVPYASDESSAADSDDDLESVTSDDDERDETLLDRIAALKDIVPPSTRLALANNVSKAGSFVKGTGKVVGNIVWVLTTSALLIALPLGLALEDEAKLVAQEKEMFEQQQGTQGMMPTMYPQAEQPKGIVPPGF